MPRCKNMLMASFCTYHCTPHPSLRAFYTNDEDYKMVHAFNHAPAKFDFNELLKKLGHDVKL